MPLPPHRLCAGHRALSAAVLAALIGLHAGCETVRPDPPHEPIARSTVSSDPPPPASPSATLPGKHATRRGCCVLYHDFELDADDADFASLESLADQVYGEL